MSLEQLFPVCPMYDAEWRPAKLYMNNLTPRCERCFGLGVYEDLQGSIRLCDWYAKWRYNNDNTRKTK